MGEKEEGREEEREREGEREGWGKGRELNVGDVTAVEKPHKFFTSHLLPIAVR